MASHQDTITVANTVDVLADSPLPGTMDFDTLEPGPTDISDYDCPQSAPQSQGRPSASTVPADQSPTVSSSASKSVLPRNPVISQQASRKRGRTRPFPVAVAKKRRVTQSDERSDTSSNKNKAQFSREMTDQVMIWFDDCRKRGLFNSTKKKDYGPVWEEISARCQEKWPRFIWNAKVISTKYDTERRRFQLWNMLMEGYSGVSIDPDTGLPLVSEETWEQFRRRNTTTSKSVNWLRSTPLGDIPVYRSVFFRERASGGFIAEVDEAVNTQVTAATNLDSEDSGRDDPACLDLESNDTDDDLNFVSQTPVPARRLTAAQRRRIETDPDQTPISEGSPATLEVPSSSQSTQESYQECDSAVLDQSFRDAISILAAPRLPGANDVALAVEDIQAQFAGVIDDKELLNCIEYLQANPMRAVMWNKLSLSIKKLYIERWKGGG